MGPAPWGRVVDLRRINGFGAGGEVSCYDCDGVPAALETQGGAQADYAGAVGWVRLD